MSRIATATINYELTNYAQGYAGDAMVAQRVARAIAPVVLVSGAAGQYKQYDDRNSFLTYNTARGIGGVAQRVTFEATDPSFVTEAQALDIAIDDQERKQADGAPGGSAALERNKIRSLLNRIMLSHAKKVVDFAVANTTAVAGKGQWSNPDIDPIDQLDEQLDLMSTDVGSTENINLILSTSSWRALRSNAKVKARCTGVQVGGITIEQLQGMLMYPVSVVVGALPYTAVKPGANSVTKSQVLGSNVFLAYSVPTPSQFDPSGIKLFTTGEGLITSVRQMRDDSARSDVFMVDWDEVLKVTGSAAIKRLVIS